MWRFNLGTSCFEGQQVTIEAEEQPKDSREWSSQKSFFPTQVPNCRLFFELFTRDDLHLGNLPGQIRNVWD
jgi:hypothetical protein